MARRPLSILDRHPAVQRLSQADRALLVAKVVGLAREKFTVGQVSEDDMREAGIAAYFDTATIVATAGLAMNRQRALCITSEAAVEMKAAYMEARKAKRDQVKRKQDAAYRPHYC